MIDDKDAIDKLNKTDKKAKTTGEKLGGMAKTAGKVGSAVVGMGALAAGAMIKIATNTAEAGDRVDKMSQKIGLSREGFQEWAYVMSQSGMSIDSMQGGMKRLVNSFDDMKKGGKTATDAFNRVGLSMDDLQGKSNEEIFEMTVSGLQNVTDETERAALANDLFGRSGSEMAPLLNQSADSVANLKQQAHDMGMVLGNDAVDGAVKMQDTMNTLKRAGAGLMNSLGSALMPVLQKVLDVIIDNMPAIQELISRLTPILASVFDKLLPPLMDLVEALLPPILELIEQIMPVLGELMDAIMPVIIDLLDMLLPPVIEIVRKLLPVLLAVLKPLLPLLDPLLEILQPFIDLLMMIIDPLIEILDLILPPLAVLLGKLFNWYLPKLSSAFSGVAKVLGDSLKSAFNAVKPILDTLKRMFSNLIDFIKNVFTGNWKGAWGNIVNHFKLIWEGMKNIFKAPINWIIDGLNRFIRGINKVKIPSWVPAIGGRGINIPSIPRLKVGLDYVPYDDFPVLLHKGERVMTAEENERGREPGTVYNIYLNDMPASDTDKRKLAQYIEEERRRGLRAKGATA
jgi:phage-related protein